MLRLADMYAKVPFPIGAYSGYRESITGSAILQILSSAVIADWGCRTAFLCDVAVIEFGAALGRARRICVFYPAFSSDYCCWTAVSLYWPTFLYSVTDLGTLPGYSFSVGMALNDVGQVTGNLSQTFGGSPHAFLYSDGQITDLGTLGGYSYSNGFNLNNAGQVTGSFLTSAGTFHAFLYSNGQMTDLGPGAAYGINNAGQVTGASGTPNGHAFLYSNGQMMDLGTLGGNNSVGYGLNNAGQVVGRAYALFPDAPSIDHAFLYSNGQMQDLGTLGGSCCSDAFGINNSGEVVGTSYTASRAGPVNAHAFLYRNGQLTDLNNLIDPALGISLAAAYGINDQGQIVADAETFSGARTYLLTPTSTVPEPSTLALIGLGLWARPRTRKLCGTGTHRH